MIPGVCDTEERIAARIYAAVRSAVDPDADPEDDDCPCCAFWRGGAFVGIIVVIVSLLIALSRGCL